jgi:hypothetical protein
MSLCASCEFFFDAGLEKCEECGGEEKKSLFVQSCVLSKTLVIGASYCPDDAKYWSVVDENYIGIGRGTSFGGSSLHWNTFSWNDSDFWEKKLPVPENHFKQVFLDRCVWNCFVTDLKTMKNMLNFIVKNMEKNAMLCIPMENWRVAEKSYLQTVFCPDEKFKTCLDLAGFNEIVSMNLFRISTCDDFATHPSSAPQQEGRKRWQRFFLKIKK